MVSKLVRDKIPSIIEAEGRKASYVKVNGSTLKWLLLAKLKEEVDEVRDAALLGDAAYLAEEVADVLTVLNEIIATHGIKDQVIDAYDYKLRNAGGFKDGIVLEVGVKQ